MPIPFLNSIKLNKNQVEDFCVFNYSGDPTLSSGADFGYLWLNTSATPKVLKFWDGTNYRTLIDSTTISSSTAGLATDLAGGGAGQIVYQNASNDTMFLSAGTSGQVLSSNGASAPSWLNQSSLSVGSATTATTATNVAGGANGSILVQSGVGTTGNLAIGSNGYILTSNGTTPGWSASIPSTSVSGLASSATTDTTNASNISSGTLGLARLALASGQFYVGDASNNPAATAKSSIPLSGFGAAGADVAMGGYKITGLADPAASTDAATRGYVDSVAQGLDVKASCLVATTSNITLSSPGAVTIDGVYSATDFVSGQTRILVKAQTTSSQNGIYIWNGPSSAMTRSTDADAWSELVGAFTFIERGDTLADTGWVCTVDAGGTLGTTAVTWSQFSGAGSYTAGNGIVLSGNTFHFAQSSAYTAGRIPFASSTTAMGFNANLHWDNSNNRLGIGTPTPSASLEITSNTNGQNRLFLNNPSTGSGAYVSLDFTAGTSNNQILSIGSGYSGSFPYSTGALVIRSNNVNGIVINTSGSAAPITFGINDSPAMTLNGTGLGIGTATISERLTVSGNVLATDSAGTYPRFISTVGAKSWEIGYRSGTTNYELREDGTTRLVVANGGNCGIGTTTPAYKLDVNGSINATTTAGISITSSSNSTLTFKSAGSATPFYYFLDSSRNLIWQDNATERMVLTSGGNLGLGVTPKSWRTSVVFKAFQIGYTGALYSLGASEQVNLASNYYQDTSGNELRIENGYVTRYQQASGAHIWSNAGTGNAGTGFTLTPAMTLDASGRLLLGAVSVPDTGLSFYNSNGTVGLGHYLTSTVAYVGTWTNHALALASNGTERLRIKTTGQVNFVGLASDPAGAAGDVYYNSGSNVFKVYDTGWKTLPRKYVVQLSDGSVTVAGNAYTITHNLGSQDVTVSIRRTTDNAVVQADVVMPAGGNTVTVTFAAAITASQFYVTVIG